MNSIKSIVLMLISILFSFCFTLVVNAANAFPDLETQIHEGSNETKIKKMQLALSELSIYSGEIDGNYESVKDSLISYQVSTGINKDLGYFGVKTLTALKEDFPDKFDAVAEEYLKMDEPSKNVRNFYITAYYSPLPGQKRYTTGSYSGDLKLNGNGKTTASGKGVFEGILAAPRNYDFGTKIEFEGLGVGVVEDRGGAIVNAGERGHEYDRIDVWMGYGDEGLERALKWGQRTVVGKVVPNTREIGITFDTSVVSKYNGLKVDAEFPDSEEVKRLQSLFAELSLYSGEINGDFSEIKNDLIKFQIENNIISSKNDPHAGYFGDKTYAVLRKMFGGGVFKQIDNKLDEDVILSDDMREKLDKVNDKISKIIEDKYGKDTSLALKYRKDIRKAIEIQTNKLKSDLRKRQLKYLRSVL